MSYDEALAARARDILLERDGELVERKMFGGICFMVDGAMCCGVINDDLIVKVGPEQHAEALARPHARPFDFTGRPSKGIVYVAPAGTRTKVALAAWIDRGLAARSVSRPRRRARRRPR